MSPKNRRYTDEERQQIFDAQNQVLDRIEEKRQIKNSRYRQSIVFRVPFALRILFLLFFAWLYFFPNDWGQTTIETVTSFENGIFLQTRSLTVSKVDFTTDQGSYCAHFEGGGGSSLYVGQELNIYHNLFGKASFFGPVNSLARTKLWINWVMLSMIALLTMSSFTFTGLEDPWTMKIHWLTWVANLFAFGYYFFAC